MHRRPFFLLSLLLYLPGADDKLFIIALVFLRKLLVQHSKEGELQPVPLKWLDSFAMRNFTNDPLFDDTLPVADGKMEIGARVPLGRLQAAMLDWFQRKGYLSAAAELKVTETSK